MTIANRKGGSGKTTTAVNIAAAWAQAGYQTLLIDLDTQGHAAMGLGMLKPMASERCIHRIFTDQQVNLAELVQPSTMHRLSFIPADMTFDGSQSCNDWQRLRQHVHSDAIQQRFDRIVIDTAPGQDIALYNALAAADGVLIPCTMQHLTAVGVRQLAQLIYKVSIHIGKPLRLFAILPVMTAPRERMHQRVEKQFSKRFGAMRILTGVRRDVRLAEAFEHSQPIISFAGKSRGAADYQQACHELEAMIQGDLALDSNDAGITDVKRALGGGLSDHMKNKITQGACNEKSVYGG